MAGLIGSDDDPRWVDFVQGGGEYNQGPDRTCPVCKRFVKAGASLCDHDTDGKAESVAKGRRYVDQAGGA